LNAERALKCNENGPSCNNGASTASVGERGASVGTLRLWSDEIEAMRAEARAVVAAGVAANPLDVRVDPGLSFDEQVVAARAPMAAVTFPLETTEERVIGGVLCRIIRPEGAPRAIYLHFHGGGMISGSAALMDIPNQMRANELGVTVVSVDYRQGPEFPWPAGPDDGVAVARELLGSVGAELGADRLLIGGESAGGYMAAAVALRIRDELHAIDRVVGLNLIYGELDWSANASHQGRRGGDGFDILSPEFMRLSVDCYVPGKTEAERRAPEISPPYADLRGLPPCFVSVGTCDHLLDDSLLFAARAAAAEVSVDLFVLPDMPHGFQVYGCEMTRAWTAAEHAWLAERLA
jgi:acetyl esterase